MIALYGGAKPLAACNDVYDAYRVMDTIIRLRSSSFEKRTLQGDDLCQLGKLLGVLPTMPAYGQRLDAALRMMPGVSVENITTGVPIRYTMRLPVMAQPVIFVHGGGDHPYDSLIPHAPTNNIMGTFAGGAHLAIVAGELAFVSTHGVSTLPLMRLEGRPEAIPRTSSFVVVAGSTIAERTHATQFPFFDTQEIDLAVAIIGSSGIGTLQEALSFRGPLIIVAADDDPVARHIGSVRGRLSLPTHYVAPSSVDIEQELQNFLPEQSAEVASISALNALYPVFAFAGGAVR